MGRWQLQHNLVTFECLRLRLHRIARSSWRSAGVLRSWGAVALHRQGKVLHVPCADDEALWLGAWLEDDAAIGSVHLVDLVAGCAGQIVMPGAFQLSSLLGSDATLHPLVYTPTQMTLTLACGQVTAPISLVMHPPSEWALRFGRPVPEVLVGPPPLPPRLG